MNILVTVGTLILQLIYRILRLQKVKNQIVFISRQSDNESDDFRLLREEINLVDDTIHCIVLTKTIPKGKLGKIHYLGHMMKQMHYMATSRVVILDTYCIVVSLLNHREELKVIQIWHALGAFKKIGYSVIGGREGSSEKIARVMKMHRNYDYVTVSSEYCRGCYAEAFDVDLEKVRVFPLPRLDLLQAEQKKHDQKIKVLYVPTFRKEKLNMGQKANEIWSCLDSEKYELVVRLHPLSDDSGIETYIGRDKGKTLYQSISESDVIITDYSSVIFEAAYLSKKIILFPFDYDSYKVGRDFYLDYKKDLPFKICRSTDELKRSITDVNQGCDELGTKKFVDKYIKETKSSYTKEMSAFIVSEYRK